MQGTHRLAPRVRRPAAPARPGTRARRPRRARVRPGRRARTRRRNQRAGGAAPRPRHRHSPGLRAHRQPRTGRHAARLGGVSAGVFRQARFGGAQMRGPRPDACRRHGHRPRARRQRLVDASGPRSERASGHRARRPACPGSHAPRQRSPACQRRSAGHAVRPFHGREQRSPGRRDAVGASARDRQPRTPAARTAGRRLRRDVSAAAARGGRSRARRRSDRSPPLQCPPPAYRRGARSARCRAHPARVQSAGKHAR